MINEVNGAADPGEHAQLVARMVGVAEPLNGTYARAAGALAAELSVTFVLGMLQVDGTRLFNAAVTFAPNGSIVSVYHKTHFAQGYAVSVMPVFHG